MQETNKQINLDLGQSCERTSVTTSSDNKQRIVPETNIFVCLTKPFNEISKQMSTKDGRPFAIHILKTRPLLRYVIGFGHVRSFDSKSAHRISQEPLDLESPNFTKTFIPTYPTATPDMTSLSTLGGRVKRKKLSKIPPK